MGAHNKIPFIAKTPDIINTPQVGFSKSWFEQTIETHGYDAQIERALRCPCKEKATGQASTGCLNCGGTAWLHIDMVQTRIVCQGIGVKNKYENWSMTDAGIVSITTKAEDKLGFMDKIVLTELESWYSQTIYMRAKQTSGPIPLYFSFLTYKPIKIFDVYVFVNADTALHRLDEGEYSIEYNKILIDPTVLKAITDAKEPCVSIRYVHNPTYYVIDINRDLVKVRTMKDCGSTDLKTNYPLHCIARKAHYVLDDPNYDGVGLFDNTDYEKPKPNYDY